MPKRCRSFRPRENTVLSADTCWSPSRSGGRGRRVGTLYLRSDYERTFLELLGFYGLGRCWASWSCPSVWRSFLSSRLGRTITHPILQLARTAQVVGEKKDYSVRAVVSSRGDELGRLTESFNEMLSRIQSQDAALSLSQQKMEALINSIDGIVWERTPDRTSSSPSSAARAKTFSVMRRRRGWTSRTSGKRNCSRRTPPKPFRPATTWRPGREPYSYEYRMIAADGRTVWIRESGTVLVEKGQPVAMRGIFQDITRHKSDAEQLDKLNRQLMDTSRQAGMAEVATGVLHNVGNVLNSVSVSATLVADRLRRSKVGQFAPRHRPACASKTATSPNS